MLRALGWCFYWIARAYDWAAQKCGYVPPVPEVPPVQNAPAHLQQVQVQVNVWEMLAQGRMGVRLITEEALQESLANRPRVGRDQGVDNPVLAPLSDAINRAVQQGDYRLAAEVFRENYAHVLAYEQLAPPCEVHKGALAFDVARGYLRGWDFFAAMHYFELAQAETIKTTGDNNFSVYTFDLFGINFWDAVQVNTVAHPIPIYNEFWLTPYNKTNALDDYDQMSKNSKLAYIIASAERVRLQNIEDHSGWDGSDALRLGYWTLASDLARLLEVEAKVRFKVPPGAVVVPAPGTLIPCLEQGFKNTAFQNISAELNPTIYNMFPRQDNTGALTPSQLYENHFDPLLARIRNAALTRKERICAALYLLGFTRNQVAHKVDKGSKLFTQLADAKFMVDLFLALCRTKEWAPL